jgi:hypothetical protein
MVSFHRTCPRGVQRDHLLLAMFGKQGIAGDQMQWERARARAGGQVSVRTSCPFSSALGLRRFAFSVFDFFFSWPTTCVHTGGRRGTVPVAISSLRGTPYPARSRRPLTSQFGQKEGRADVRGPLLSVSRARVGHSSGSRSGYLLQAMGTRDTI